MGEFKNEKEIVEHFQRLRANLQEMYSKVAELNGEIAEHDVVLKALEPMDSKRKCFRLVGDVLVERNIGEVLPAVKKNKENLDQLIKSLQETCKKQENELSEFQVNFVANAKHC
jgi:prefoldin subunit 2